MATSVEQAGRTGVKSEPNVIPMIDVMLVLLIIFMIVTPLIASGFKAVMPQGDNLLSSPDGEGEVVLGIDEAGRFFLNGQAIPSETLQDQLTSIFAVREKDKILYFRADQKLKYGKIQEALEIARQAGVRVLAAITEKKGLAEKGLFETKE